MSHIAQQITVKNLSDKESMMLAWPILAQRYKNLTKEKLSAQIDEMIAANDFKMVAAFLGDEIVGVAGYWILLMLYCGRYIQVSSFIVDEQKRGLGIGRKILQRLEEIGRDLDCEKMVLDSYTENKKSHSLYYRNDFHIRGFHFMKDL